MYNVEFYKTADGYSEICDFLDTLRRTAATVKDARIQFQQISRYIQLLQENGTNLPVEIVKCRQPSETVIKDTIPGQGKT